jgi:hypothetical protein
MTDSRRVLDLLAQGKISVEEAEQLLRAMTGSADPAAPAGEPRVKPRFLRIAVHKAAGPHGAQKDVNIRVPLGIVRSGMRLGALIPAFASDQVSACLRERGIDIDFSKLDDRAIESLLEQLGQANIDIDAGEAQVRITSE